MCSANRLARLFIQFLVDKTAERLIGRLCIGIVIGVVYMLKSVHYFRVRWQQLGK